MKRVIVAIAIGVCMGVHAATIQSWNAYDANINAMYSVTDAAIYRLPPGERTYELSPDAIPFMQSAFPQITGASAGETIMGVPGWRVLSYESNGTLITEINGIIVHTGTCPSYDAHAWSEAVYGTPPNWLSASELSAWYNDRRRDRVRFRMTLIPSEYYNTYLQNLQVAASSETPQGGLPSKPKDVNEIAFSQLSPSGEGKHFGFQLYAPKDMQVNVFGKKSLDEKDWKFLGSVEAVTPFTPASVGVPDASSYFLKAVRADLDSDGDGIPDGLELYHYHTNPYKWDSGNSGVSDGAKILCYGLNPNVRDTDGDGYDDDEELLTGKNPTKADSGAGNTIRYLYDADDRLAATYAGSNQGSVTTAVSPAGNVTVTQEREGK